VDLRKGAEMSWLKDFGELLSKIWPLLLVLAVAVAGWWVLSEVAFDARQNDTTETVNGPNTTDYGTAKDWATDLLGLAATLGGFLGIATAARGGASSEADDRARRLEGGMAGLLAGAILLDVGGVAVPVALATLVAGSAVVRATRALRSN
jgi:hypothetical protein